MVLPVVLAWTNEHTALWLPFNQTLNLFLISFEVSVSGLIVALLRLDCFLSYTTMSAGAKLGIWLGVTVFVFGFQYCLGALVGVIISHIDGPNILL